MYEDHLDPWSTWKAFKTFLHREVTGAYDAASFQCAHDNPTGNAFRFFVYLVRQFTEPVRGEGTNSEDELVGRLVVELRYPPLPYLAGPRAEIWTHDFPNNADWAAIVEGLPGFQEAMARAPEATSIYYESFDE